MSNAVKSARMEPDNRQQQIIAVAATHFARDGYDRASMARIGADAGVTRALIYHYFPSKTALFEAVLRHEADTLLALTQFDPMQDVFQNIRQAIFRYLEHFSPANNHAINLHLQANRLPDMVERISRNYHEIMTAQIMMALNLHETPLLRGALMAWLDFVSTLSREVPTPDAPSRHDAVELCVTALQAIIPKNAT